MEAKRGITLRLLLNCTLRGGLYGLIGGTVSGLILMFYGAILGAPLDCALGFGFGLLNGLAIRVLTPYGRNYISKQRYMDSVTICCFGASAIIDATLVALDLIYLHTMVLTYTCLFGIPAILISAKSLASFVADWYPKQFEIIAPQSTAADAPGVWPPAPRPQ